MCAHCILTGIVPGSEDLLTEEQPPWSVPLLGTHLFGILFTLGDGIHDVVVSTAQRGHLGRGEKGEGRENRGRRREGGKEVGREVGLLACQLKQSFFTNTHIM